jgi:uncharacterized coiled-coil DUF342 family protein
MEDDGNRLISPLKTGWNQLLEGILEQNQDSQLLGDNHQAIYNSLDELNKHLQQLSQYRHQLNCRLEAIKREVESLQYQAVSTDPGERRLIDQGILKLEEEGYGLQLELENLENRIRKIRTLERSNSNNHTRTNL